MIEYLTINIKGNDVMGLSDYFTNKLGFIGSVKVCGNNHDMILSGWTKHIDVEYVLQCELPKFKGLKGELV